MRKVADNGFLSALAVNEQRDQVAHGPGRDKQRGFLSHHPGCQFLQSDHGWVIAKNIISDLSLCHGFAHFGGGPGNGVRTKVNGFHILLLCYQALRRFYDQVLKLLPIQPSQDNLLWNILKCNQFLRLHIQYNKTW